MKRVVFAHTVEGLLYRSLAGKVTPQLKADLRMLGVDLDSKPVDVEQGAWVEILRKSVVALYPHLPLDDGYYALGHHLIDGYAETLMGKTLIGMMRLLGPLRTIRRSMTNLRSGNTYSEATHKELAPNRHQLWVNECNGNPNYLRGVMSAALEKSGASKLAVAITSFDGHAATFDVAWE